MNDNIHVQINMTQPQYDFLGRLLEHANQALKLMNISTTRFERLMEVFRTFCSTEENVEFLVEIEDAEDFHEILMSFLQFSILSENESPEVSELRELFLNGIAAYWNFLDDDVNFVNSSI